MQDRQRKYCLDLPAHMAECDTNYLRLMKLFPKLRQDESLIFGVDYGTERTRVLLQVVERSRYTTLLRLNQVPEKPWGAYPSLLVRLYHDARTAEVVEYQRSRHFSGVYRYPNEKMRLPDEKAQINRVLGEFLGLCLEHGLVVEDPAVLIS